MSGTRHTLELATLTETYEVVSGSVSLDDSRLPYMEADAVVSSLGGPLDEQSISPTVGLNNGSFTLKRFAGESTTAEQTLAVPLHCRRARLDLDGTISADFASVESLLGDLYHADYTLPVTGLGTPPTVGAALSWLFTNYLVNQTDARYPFALSGTVPTINITLADGQTNVELREAQNLLTWMDPYLAKAGKVLRANEAGQLVIADRASTTAGAVTAAAGVNMVGYSEEIDRDSDLYGNAVSVHYEESPGDYISRFPWIPGTPASDVSKIFYVDRSDVPSPFNTAAGVDDRLAVASGIYFRLQTRFKRLTARLTSDYTWRPGMSASIVSPFGQTFTGVVQSVRWFFPDAEMDVEFRDVELVP